MDKTDGEYVAPLERHFARFLTPFEQFIHRQTTSGILLMVSTLIALALANSAFSPQYAHVSHLPIGLTVGSWSINYSLLHWINDGLMALFFFVVGLELKREILVGELASLRRAALPVIAAIGGMIVPALIYINFNPSGSELHGWAIPMATDIAFAVGVLALLGSRVPKSLVTFLVALAIADDLGAVIVIALFYTSEISIPALAGAGFITFLLLLLNAGGVRKTIPYFLLAIPLWYCLLLSGVHPTLAGVIGAFTIPARPRYNPQHFSKQSRELLQKFDASLAQNPNVVTNDDMRAHVQAIEHATQKTMAPLQRLEGIWHIPVAFLVIPVFALFNAGIPLNIEHMSSTLSSPVMQGVAAGLFFGKFIGIFGFAMLAVKLGIAALPANTTAGQIAGVSLLGGIGFTMSIFISQLSFPMAPEHVVEAKTGIFLASLLSGIIGCAILWFLGRRKT